MKCKFLLFLLLALSFTTTISVSAQPGKTGRDHSNKKLTDEMRTYVEQNIKPVILQQRQKLEKQLVASDKRKIKEIRTRLAKLKSERELNGQNWKKRHEHKPANKTEEQKRNISNYRLEMELIMTEARALADKYNPTINRLFNEISNSIEIWKQDLRSIYLKASSAAPNRPAHRTRHYPVLNNYLQPVLFLLLDVNNPLVEINKKAESKNKVYPNPAEKEITLEYTLYNKDKVIINILNEQGNIVKEVSNKMVDAGTYKIQIDLSTLRSGIYFYNIITSAGTENIRFLKK